MTAHVHCILIKLWADGAKIEVQNPVNGQWYTDHHPTWDEHVKYRLARPQSIAPQPQSGTIKK